MMRYTLQVVIAAVGILSGVLLSVGDTYAAQPIKNTPAGVPRVVDANGKLVGQVIGTDLNGSYNPNVVLNISPPNIIVSVTPNSFRGNKNLYFTGANCSGQPYFGAGELGDAHMFPFVGVVRNIIHEPQANTGPVPFTYFSFIPAYQSDCTNSQGDYTGIVAVPIIDLSTQFTPPYSFVYP